MPGPKPLKDRPIKKVSGRIIGKRRKAMFPMCPSWPMCHCIEQGFINPKEPRDCGKKPRKPPRRVIIFQEVGWE